MKGESNQKVKIQGKQIHTKKKKEMNRNKEIP